MMSDIRFARMSCIARWLDCDGPGALSRLLMQFYAVHRLGT
jgi:hypothetical protein